MTTAQNPEPGDRPPDTFGGPDAGSGREDELAGPGGAPGPGTFGGPDRGEEDELAGPGGGAGPDTFGGPDRGEEDELRPEA